ncbi:MAG TPA: DegT/DnrJ/EryC1/StrS family aminotransferase [Allosphingosinicella sp.]|nr:DegT/DnrJ/EryC1/StrS family aminotransferase [Allosphingosinicella sp.]
MPDPVRVTRPFLPPLDEMLPLLREMWESRILTNEGPFHQRFEAALSTLLGGRPASLVANGTLALSIALDAAGIEGEVVTTPYSFVATSHAVRMGRLTPVFADIRPDTLNLDPAAAEAAITPRTSAILAVHVYGTPCDVEALAAIARRRGLVLIYDAAHAFGVRLHGRSIAAWGDFSTFSFHATKAFNTFEGGAVVAGADGKARADRLRNFGIVDELHVDSVGGNAKMNEFCAALGLLQLDHFETVRAELARIDRLYRILLADLPGLHLLPVPEGVEPNHAYFPLLVGPGFRTDRDGLHDALKAEGIHARRYFYPLLANLPMYRGLASAAPANLPVANDAAARVLCLPIHTGLGEATQRRIAAVVRGGARP